MVCCSAAFIVLFFIGFCFGVNHVHPLPFLPMEGKRGGAELQTLLESTEGVAVWGWSGRRARGVGFKTSESNTISGRRKVGQHATSKREARHCGFVWETPQLSDRGSYLKLCQQWCCIRPIKRLR
jgi:hypothetical protein